jgi:hypothetical protein
MDIGFAADELVNKKLGIVQGMTLDPITVNFFPAGTGAPSPKPHHSLQSNCTDMPVGSCPPYLQTYTRSLPLKFVNFSLNHSSSDVETLCNNQIQKLCEVWRDKAALQFNIQSLLIQATNFAPSFHKDNFHILNLTQEYSGFGGASGTTIETLGYDSTTQIEVYLIDQFTVTGRHGGGIGYNFGQASAYIILDLGLAGGNPYLLAHEIGHVLGLAHPFGTPNLEQTGLIDSSPGSIMTPSASGSSNPPKNSLFNCRVFLDPQPLSNPNAKTLNCTVQNPQPPLNTIVSSIPASSDCYRPNPVDHFIRDFPTDGGVEPSSMSNVNFWDFSNVWNRQSNTPGALISGAPDHQAPLICTDPAWNFTNYMWVKVEQITELSDPVYVELYLAEPGSSRNLRLLQDSSGNSRLVFCPPPVQGTPISKALDWIMPDGYPSHCCVFAISYSDDDPSPITDPTSQSFGTVSPLVLSHNGIAQRNLNIQETTCPNPRPCSTALAWLQFENPFDAPAPAKLEIDATGAAQLDNLLIEIDSQITEKIESREPVTIEFDGLLQPGEVKIFRFHATLPPGMLPLGTELPIHIKFIVNEKTINGYTHVIRISPIERTVVQVLDNLFGALRDVVVGYKLNIGLPLLEKTKKIVLTERRRVESTGCLGLFWRFFRSKTKWRSEIAKLSTRIATLAQDLLEITTPEDEGVRQGLYELAGLLLSPTSTSAPVYIEQIRELADRLQEPAGRLARQQMEARPDS